MRRRLLVIVPSVVVVTLVLAFGVTLLQTGTKAAGSNRAGFLTVNIAGMRTADIHTIVEPITALQGAPWPLSVVAEPDHHIKVLLARGPRIQCRIENVPPQDQLSLQGLKLVFEDPCGAALYTLGGTCMAGPCPRGMDQFPVVVTNGRARIDLNTLEPGPPRSG